jgi:hypothetical protein
MVHGRPWRKLAKVNIVEFNFKPDLIENFMSSLGECCYFEKRFNNVSYQNK